MSPALPSAHSKTPALPQAPGYVLHEYVGRGSSGTVWRATQEGTLREVALKFLEAWRAHDLGRLRFAREAEIAAALEHEGIARVFGSGESAGGPWLAMELVDGPPLDHWVAENVPPLRERVAIFSRICAAVRYAHQRGVLHRDLKPSNVLVAADGTPKVVDFGLACWLDGPSLEVTLTQQGEVFGSLAWMPPEQAAGRWAEVDALSDVYALGAVFYSLLAGGPPLDAGLPPAALLTAAQSGERQDVREVSPQTPRDLAAVVKKCLAAEKARRYQSAAELEADVHRWLAGEPVQARTAAPLYWLGKKIRRHWVAVAAGVTVTFSGVGLTWGYLKGQRARDEEKLAAERRAAAQTAGTLHQAQELVAQLLVEMRPKFEEAGHPEWINEAEQRVAAFPWEIGEGGTGAYDSRRFRGRAALVQGDILSTQGQWGNALDAYHEAINQLKTLVLEQPQVRIFREDLARARIGESMSLVKLKFHKEAFGASQKALQLLEPRSGESISVPIWGAMVDAVCALAQAASPAEGKVEAALEIVTGMAGRLPDREAPEQMTIEEAGWHSRIHCEAARLTVMLKEQAKERGAKEAEPFAAKAVAAARQAVKLTGDGELALRQLVVALAMESDIARRQEDSTRTIQLLKEATGILLERLGPPSLILSVAPYELVAAQWEDLAHYLKHLGDDMKVPGNYAWASECNRAAIKVWERIRQRSKDKTSIAALSRLSLENAHLLRMAGKDAEAVPWAARNLRQFEIAVEGKTCGLAVAMNAVEAALVLIEIKEPDRGGGAASWKECAARALRWISESRMRLDSNETTRRAELAKRMAALP